MLQKQGCKAVCSNNHVLATLPAYLPRKQRLQKVPEYPLYGICSCSHSHRRSHHLPGSLCPKGPSQKVYKWWTGTELLLHMLPGDQIRKFLLRCRILEGLQATETSMKQAKETPLGGLRTAMSGFSDLRSMLTGCIQVLVEVQLQAFSVYVRLTCGL